MAAVSAILAAAQTGSEFSAQQNAAAAASQRGGFQNDIAERNAQLAERQGSDAINRGAMAEDRQRLETTQAIGSSRAALAAQGIDVSAGSAADVQTNESAIGEVDALTIRNNAALQAWGYDVEASNERMQGKLALLAGENEASALRTQSISTLISGVTNVASGLKASSGSKTRVQPGSGHSVTAPVVTRGSGSGQRTY